MKSVTNRVVPLIVRFFVIVVLSGEQNGND